MEVMEVSIEEFDSRQIKFPRKCHRRLPTPSGISEEDLLGDVRQSLIEEESY